MAIVDYGQELTDSKEPEDPTQAELTIGPEHVADQDLATNGSRGKDVGVLLQVDGLEGAQEVTFTVTRQTRNADPVEPTVTANEDGLVESRITQDNVAQRGAPLRTYDVEPAYGNDEVLTGSFTVFPNLSGKRNKNSNAKSNNNHDR